MSENSSMESMCIFHKDGDCYILESAPGKCSFCFNFSTTEKPGGKGKNKPIYSMFDYLRSRNETDLIFPSGNYVQDTL
jgi:hypothetical protein